MYWSQGCAKIPKRSGIQDPQDPRSGILMDLGSSISGFVVGSWGSWIQHFRFCCGILGIVDLTCPFCREILMNPGSCFSLCRGILGILDPHLYSFGGSWGSWILMLCLSVGSRGSWIPNFLHCMDLMPAWTMHAWTSTFG